jgi:hypothetical protein
MRIKGFKPVWSDAFMLGLIVLAATVLFPAPDRLPSLSISAPLGHGVYIAGLIVCAVGFFILRARENEAALLKMAGLSDQITGVRTEAARHHAESQQQYETQIGEMKKHHEAQLSEHKETRQLVVEVKQRLAETEAAHGPPLKIAGLNSAVTLAEAVLAEEAHTIFSPPIRSQWWVPTVQAFTGGEEFPEPMRELQAALRDLEQNPPTDPSMALATAKRLSSLSQVIPNTPADRSIAEHKAEVGNVTTPSESSSGAHRPPKSSS